MKKLLAVMVLLLLPGCAVRDDAMQEALGIRGKLIGSDCTFRCTITADYDEQLERFSLLCEWDSDGEMDFTVTAPESISGITGTVDGEQGQLTFDDQVLAFPLLDQDRLSPVHAPWILMQTLRTGCITSVARTDSGLLLCIDDSYDDDALNLEIRTDGTGVPVSGEISRQGRRMVSMVIEGFTYG